MKYNKLGRAAFSIFPKNPSKPNGAPHRPSSKTGIGEGISPEGSGHGPRPQRGEETSTEPALSSIPKSSQAANYLMWNKDAYAKHCRDRDALLAIKSGAFSYEELLERAHALISKIEAAGASCDLPESVDTSGLVSLRVSLRRAFDRLTPWGLL